MIEEHKMQVRGYSVRVIERMKAKYPGWTAAREQTVRNAKKKDFPEGRCSLCFSAGYCCPVGAHCKMILHCRAWTT